MRILCRVPVRVSFGNGGDTDYYVGKIGWGCIVNATLSSHFYEFEINDENGGKIDIIDYFNNENPNRTYTLDENVSELDLLKATMEELGLDFPATFIVRTNVPMQSGLGGSSSLHIAMISAMLRYKNEQFDHHRVASLAYHIERNKMKVPGGYQDQFAAAYGGGFNYMEFKDRHVGVKNLNLPEETIRRMERNILIYYMQKRDVSGSAVHESQKRNAQKDSEKVKKLLVEKRVNAVRIRDALLDGDLDGFGRLLMKEGEIKKRLAGKKGCGFAEEVMQTALDFGALGGKVSGAGGGGCVLFYVPEESQERFRQGMKRFNAIELDFRFQRPYEPGIQLRVVS